MSMISRRIADIFAECHRGETACDENFFVQKIDSYVKQNQPVPFYLLAFPEKSINEKSVSGHLPDLGEELAFRTLRDLIDRARYVYAPGIEIHIFSEGHFFMPVGCTRPAQQIDEYVAGLRAIKDSDKIHIHTIHDLYPEGVLDQKMAAFRTKYLPSAEETRVMIEQDTSIRKRYADRLAFIYNEFSGVLYPGMTNTKRHQASKLITRNFLAHQIGVDRLSREHFGHAVRLSIHRQNDPTSQKYYINLIPEAEGMGMPWLHVVVQDGDRLKVMKKFEAETSPAYKKNFSL